MIIAEKKNVFKVLSICLLCLSLILTGCSPTSEQASNNKKGSGTEQIDVYTVADPKGDWGFPTPWGHYQRGPGYIRMSFIFDTLIWKDKEGFVPALASEWNYDKDSKTYSFVLRENVQWHDGEKLTAKDVEFTFNYMKEHPYPWGDLSSIEKIEAQGENLVKIKLKNQYAPFLSNVAATVPIIPEHIWKKVKEPEKYREKDAVIGSGPFKLEDYSKEHGTYLYKANDQYYGGKVLIKELRFVKANPQMAGAALTRGEVDAAGVQPEMVDSLKKAKFEILTESGSSNVKLMFNHRKEPLSSREFRQALAYAIDRQELVAKAQRGHGQKGNPGMLAPGNKWYNKDVRQYEPDLAKTGRLLAGLGYKLEVSKDKENGVWTRNGRQIKLELLCDSDLVRTAEILKEQLEKAGFVIEIKSVESKTRDAKIAAWDFDLALNSHGGLGGDPNNLRKFVLADDFNSARYRENSELVELLQQQVLAMDEKERKEIIDDIQELYANEIPALTLYYPCYYWAHNGKVPLYYTTEGIAIGIPIPLNKLSFVSPES